jgi:hypothetical protein
MMGRSKSCASENDATGHTCAHFAMPRPFRALAHVVYRYPLTVYVLSLLLPVVCTVLAVGTHVRHPHTRVGTLAHNCF